MLHQILQLLHWKKMTFSRRLLSSRSSFQDGTPWSSDAELKIHVRKIVWLVKEVENYGIGYVYRPDRLPGFYTTVTSRISRDTNIPRSTKDDGRGKHCSSVGGEHGIR